MTQTTKQQMYCGSIPQLLIHDSDKTPSWKLPGNKGSAQLIVDAHPVAKWVAIRLQESGPNSRRETSMTLTEESARELYKFLHALLGNEQSLPSQIQDVLTKSGFIAAVKAYREATGCLLKTAVDEVRKLQS